MAFIYQLHIRRKREDKTRVHDEAQKRHDAMAIPKGKYKDIAYMYTYILRW